MDADRMRSYLLTLPHVVETMQWGASLVFWVGDKAIGGRMFAVISLDEEAIGRGRSVISYAAGAECFAELLEREGLHPAPYLARAHWVAVEHWEVFRLAEWQHQLAAAHAIVLAKLPARTRTLLQLPATRQRRLIADRRREAAAASKPKTSLRRKSTP
ncbi:MAG: MmcQ/YjbR family DNA-binding protein [Acidobacteriota bacterium]|nr:MmcQ/YjbR family DNA-binding protein [Acidobacteriota bacterium]